MRVTIIICSVYQLKVIRMGAKLANLNHCAVPFLSAPPSTCTGANILSVFRTEACFRVTILLVKMIGHHNVNFN